METNLRNGLQLLANSDKPTVILLPFPLYERKRSSGHPAVSGLIFRGGLSRSLGQATRLVGRSAAHGMCSYRREAGQGLTSFVSTSVT
jgi:hypothetical protein